MPTEILKCPNCDTLLSRDASSFRCTNNHSFDLAKQGYLNLLLPNQKKSKLPGDNREMILNREAFLSAGYYDRLDEAIAAIIANLNHQTALRILDLGCGSGFFIRSLPDADNIKIGLDISKYAIAKAAKLDKQSFFLAGSYKHIPLLNESIDVLLNNFAPIDLEEAFRVLKPKGIIIKIVPAGHHMRQLAELIYKEFVQHSSDFMEQIEMFKELALVNKTTLAYNCKLTRSEALSLIGMTPYFHKFKLLDISLPEDLVVTFSFLIMEVQKRGGV